MYRKKYSPYMPYPVKVPGIAGYLQTSIYTFKKNEALQQNHGKYHAPKDHRDGDMLEKQFPPDVTPSSTEPVPDGPTVFDTSNVSEINSKNLKNFVPEPTDQIGLGPEKSSLDYKTIMNYPAPFTGSLTIRPKTKKQPEMKIMKETTNDEVKESKKQDGNGVSIKKKRNPKKELKFKVF